MPEHKSHHYVPQMYMRLFSRTDAKRVGIYVIKRRRFVPNAPIRGQLCRDYFYGRNPRAEKALGRVEGQASRIFSQMIGQKRVPEADTEDHEWLILYLGLQHARTAGAADQHNERSEKLAKALLRRQAELEGNTDILAALDTVKIRRTNAVSEVMGYATIGSRLLNDLTFILIQNDSAVPFLSSDTPVVLHNRLYEGQHISVTGYANVGLQLLLPLSPHLALFGFDSGAYAVAASNDGMVHLDDPSQVALLNDLQWESASAVLLVSPNMLEAELHSKASYWSQHRPAERAIFRDEIVSESETEMRTRHGSGEIPSRISLDLDFVRLRCSPPPPLGLYEVPPFRDPAWVDRVDRIFDRVHAWETQERT